MVADMYDFKQQYRALVERISGYPMREAARTRILTEVEGGLGSVLASRTPEAVQFRWHLFGRGYYNESILRCGRLFFCGAS